MENKTNNNATESTKIDYSLLRWNGRIGTWETLNKSVERSEFVHLDGATMSVIGETDGKALNRNSVCFGSVNAWECYCAKIETLYNVMSGYAQVAKRHDTEKEQEYVAKVYTALSAVLDLYGRDWVADRLMFDALLMHVGTYRMNKDTGMLEFKSSSTSTTFRKHLERTMANRMGVGDIRTYAELKAERKAKELAKKAAKAAAKAAAAEAAPAKAEKKAKKAA